MRTSEAERPPRVVGHRGAHLRSLQRRFTRRWMSGIAAGLTLLAANWGYAHRELAIAAHDVRGVPRAAAALERFDAFNTVLALVAVAVLAILALFLFRPLDRTLRAEGAWLDEAEAAQEEEATRRRFSAELHEALEMATEEQGITKVVEHVLRHTVGDRPAELLLADSSEAHLAVVASHPLAGAPAARSKRRSSARRCGGRAPSRSRPPPPSTPVRTCATAPGAPCRPTASRSRSWVARWGSCT
jgi:hypothetical protein